MMNSPNTKINPKIGEFSSLFVILIPSFLFFYKIDPRQKHAGMTGVETFQADSDTVLVFPAGNGACLLQAGDPGSRDGFSV